MEFEYITEEKKAEEVLDTFKDDKYLYIDTEVAVKDFNNIDFFNDKVRLIQIGNEEVIFIFDMFKIPNISTKIKEILENKGVIGHNIKFDIKFLKTNFDIFPKLVFDTMIASQILSAGEKERHSLDAVSFRLLDNKIDKSQQTSQWNVETLTKEQIEYSANDVKVLREIFPIQKEELNKIPTPHKSTGKIYQIFGVENGVAAVEMAFIPELANMELTGMPIDEDLLKDWLKERQSMYQRKYIEFVRKYGVDPFSPNQVTNWITKRLGLKLPKTQKGSLSSQDSALRKYINRTEIQELLSIRSEKKIIDKLKELKQYTKNGRVYSQYRQIGAPTGRMSSMHPNLQNITRELRVLFKGKEGKKLIVADYSQIELRIAAEYVKDENMIKAFKEDKDLHRFTASIITGKEYDKVGKEERQMAKAINFGLIYGISPRSLMEYAKNNYGVEISLKEAQEFQKRFFDFYSGFKKWHETVKEYLNNHQKIVVETLLGRRIVAYRFTDAVNYPIQGTGSDMLKMAVAMFGKMKGNLDANIVNLVHDEIVVESSINDLESSVKVLSESMEKAGKILLKHVPVKFDISPVETWADK